MRSATRTNIASEDERRLERVTREARLGRRVALAGAAAASLMMGCGVDAGLGGLDDGLNNGGGGQPMGVGGGGVPYYGTGSTGAVSGTGSVPGVSNGGSGSVGVGSPEWCAVEDILQTRCQNCHDSEPAFGAPMSLVTHADMLGASTFSGRPIYELALERAQSTSKPMPPPPNALLSPDEIATLQAWVAAGTPSGNCSVVPSTGGTGPVVGTGGVGPGSGGAPNADCIDCGTYACTEGYPMQILAHQNGVPGDTTPFDATNIGTTGNPNSYECFYFQAPWGASTQLIGHRPVIDNKRIMHHWLLYASENAPPDVVDAGHKTGCQLQSDPNRVLLAGWAPGTPGGNLPPGVGQALPLGARTFITLEVHYFNNQPGTPAPDRSGVEVCLTDTPRPNAATQHWLGTENINAPPGAVVTAGDTCTPSLAAGQTSTLISVWPHMHLIGTHMKLDVLRSNGIVETVHDAPFVFDNQTVYNLAQPVVINAGDRLQTTCTFQNTGAAPVAFGEGSTEEMCYMFVRAYPPGSLHNGKNGCFAGLCVPGGVMRCIDNENILTAIGGL